MMPMIKMTAVTAIAIATCLAAITAKAGEVLDRIVAAKTLTVAVVPDWPPNSFINSNSKLDGYDVDVAKGVAERLGVQVKFVTPQWDIITSGKWQSRWDMAMGGMTPTKARREKFAFPSVYFYEPSAVAVNKNSKLTDQAGLDGKRVGVTSGASTELYAQQNLVIDALDAPPFTYKFKAGEVKAYSSTAIGLDDLRLGDGVRLDAFIAAEAAISEAIASGYPIKQLGEPVFYSPASIAIELGDTEFGGKITSVIADMKKDGTLGLLSTKWFGMDKTTAN
ncbi:Cystine-binding periplasmic protein [Neorhizobium galegae bv. officinalis]|uniref:Cystine-binding periplasmic protein n=1 Tax=Neorhizobium galegae bv. officinalis TaxID=323656 RepID=A0A0T7G2E0_NEOGA|nr:transporter substrate-binding domain-containing protein [Neorhizobium galegae]CDZ41427.1 Cystine-binding periplasmic protein [Neorhizobium galegae bv. officinalis]CDZ53426.1 Cystine-binding periplasmic protein [Neorhizobium galegae bv. officinalis]